MMRLRAIATLFLAALVVSGTGCFCTRGVLSLGLETETPTAEPGAASPLLKAYTDAESSRLCIEYRTLRGKRPAKRWVCLNREDVYRLYRSYLSSPYSAYYREELFVGMVRRWPRWNVSEMVELTPYRLDDPKNAKAGAFIGILGPVEVGSKHGMEVDRRQSWCFVMNMPKGESWSGAPTGDTRIFIEPYQCEVRSPLGRAAQGLLLISVPLDIITFPIQAPIYLYQATNLH
jgi:hypothetical protein